MTLHNVCKLHVSVTGCEMHPTSMQGASGQRKALFTCLFTYRTNLQDIPTGHNDSYLLQCGELQNTCIHMLQKLADMHGKASVYKLALDVTACCHHQSCAVRVSAVQLFDQSPLQLAYKG